jgi:putative ABC transport system permease protein
MAVLQAAWRSLWRDARAGELRLLLVAVCLGVAALSSVAFLANRINAGLQRDAAQLLGGDAVVVSDQPPPDAFVQQAREAGLQVVSTLNFPTMARATQDKGGQSRLVALKAVNPGYPLRGRLQVLHNGQALDTRDIPAQGEVWVEAPLLEALALQVGDTLLLGEGPLRVSRVLLVEPDRGAGFMNFAPRVMMNEQDLPATRLVQPASRITWRLAVMGPVAAVKAYTQWAEAHSKLPEVRGVRIETLEAGRPEMRQTLDRAGKFLRLVALLAALLSAVAVALAARAFANRHLDDCAMLRVLGQSQRNIAWTYTLEFLAVGIVASLTGLCLGFGLHLVFVQLLAGLVETALPMPGWAPWGQGLGIGLTLMVAFGLPPVLQLASVPALRVIRRDVGRMQVASLSVLGLGLAGFAALLVSVSQDWWLGLMVVGGFAAALLLFAGMGWLAVMGLRKGLNEETAPIWLAMATRQLAARPGFAMVQVSALSVGLLALMLLVLLRTDLVSSWRQATPANAPDRFVINVQPEQSEDFQKTLREAGIAQFDWYPMIRGRLVAINGETITPERFQDERAQRLVDREFNLSHSAQPPSHNAVVAGQWTPEEAQGLSIEEGIAKTLRLRLGDVLRFDMAGITHEARITSVRRVDWSSMRANFFVMYPLSRMPEVPMTYIAAYRAPKLKGFDNDLLQRFPNVTNVDMGSTLNQVQRVLGQVIQAVEFLFLFTLAAGLVVLFAAVTATREERARDYAILRALGATQQLLARVQRAELMGVGALAGGLAACVALGLGWGLARFVFEFRWTGSLWAPLLGMLAGALLAWAAGWWGLRDVLRRPVVQTLREATH